MAWIEKHGSKLRVCWREEDGTRHSKVAVDRPSARLVKAEVERKLLEGSYVSAGDRRQPFLEYLANVYDGDLSIREVVRVNYHSVVDNHLRPRLEDLPIEEFTATRARRLFADLSRETSPWVTSMAHRMVRRVCRQALAEGLLPRDPMASVKVTKPQRRRPRILTPDEVAAVADAITPRYRALVLLSAWGGFSVGELGALRRHDVDFDRGTITIDEAVSTPHGRAEVGPPKAESRARTVSMPSWVMTELRRHLLEFAGEDFVFQTTNGDLVTHSNLGRTWRSAVKAAGLTPAPRFHDLRHTQASLLIQQGAHPKLIQSRMGHSSITMTMDVYGHLFPTADEELAAGLEKFKPGEGGKVVAL